MKPIVAIAVVATYGLMGSAAIAAERQALCKFTVEGKTYLNGRCNFESDPDGSFRIWDDVHTVYVNVDGNTAEASWNKNPKSFHADSPLGTLTRKGACWVNATAQICARGLRAGDKKRERVDLRGCETGKLKHLFQGGGATHLSRCSQCFKTH